MTSKSLGSFLHVQDVAWLLFVGVLFATLPEVNYDAYILLPLIGLFQILEPRLQLFASRRGQIASIAIKLALSYLLVGYTHAADSYYNAVFLIPLVSAATIFELPGVIIVTAVACLAYFSFLLPVFVNLSEVSPDLIALMSVRAAFYAIVAFVVYTQAKAKRDEMARTQEAADRLAESNKNLRLAEASLRRSERLAALGQLTAGLAHELRNPLGTIKASAELLSRETARNRPDVMSEMAGYIVTEVDRMNGLISSFLDFAKPLQIRPVRGELRPVIEDVVRQQNELAASRQVQISAHLADDTLSFVFDPDLLRLTLGNLVQNAIQASSGGQEVELRADTEGDLVRIFVRDRGEGIQPEHLESIFNPFFTTKQGGIGLGLAIVSKIIDEHHGRIHVFSQPGAGTTFEVTLPREQPA